MDTATNISRVDPLPAASPAPSRRVGADAPLPVAASKEQVAATKVPTKSEVKDSVDAINRFLEDNSEVRFSIDDDSGRSIVKVIDTETKKVLRQFPSEQSLEIGKNLSSLKGMLIDSEA